MPDTANPNTNEDYINKMYDSQLASQKSQLTDSYNQAITDLDAAKEQGAQDLQKNLNATATESQRAQKNYNEVQSAYGLTSGAMAQARLAQDNQLQADLTTLRTAQATADAGIERERALLSQQYSAAIAQAQAENDLARAQALYEEAKQQEAQLLAKQEAAAQLMASAGDYSLIGQLYGLTPEQIQKLSTPQYSGTPASSKEWKIGTVRQNEINAYIYDVLIPWAQEGMEETGGYNTTQPYALMINRLYELGWSDEEMEYAKYALDHIMGG